MRTARRFEDKRALVVGGGADGPPRPGETLPMGIGRAIAMRLADEGAQVAVTDIRLELAEATVEALSGPGLAIEADTGDPAQCVAAVEQVERELGSLDVVVCNTAVNGLLPLRVQTLDDWNRQQAINVVGHWTTAQAALGPMLQRGHGVFVFVGSAAGMFSSGGSLAYEATKAAQLGVMRHIAVRYASRGIRSNAAVLGLIDSTMVRRTFGDEAERAARRAEVPPMRREGRVEEAASAVAFLASDDASYVNGHSLIVDGGIAAAYPTPRPIGDPDHEPARERRGDHDA